MRKSSVLQKEQILIWLCRSVYSKIIKMQKNSFSPDNHFKKCHFLIFTKIKARLTLNYLPVCVRTVYGMSVCCFLLWLHLSYAWDDLCVPLQRYQAGLHTPTAAPFGAFCEWTKSMLMFCLWKSYIVSNFSRDYALGFFSTVRNC